MPRVARLDAPGTLHHVFARGIEHGEIFRDDEDRERFLERLARLALDGALAVFAWSLMPNHFHLLVRTGERALERSMRSLLTGHATSFNRRHNRVGHLFQNRYGSIVCDGDRYFAALLRYIHRNPIPSVVPDLAALDRYPYTGHATIVGSLSRCWQDTGTVLSHFGGDRLVALSRYRELVSSGARQGDLDGAAVRPGLDGWAEVRNLVRGRERFGRDERILGSRRFVRRALRELPRTERRGLELPDLVDRVCAHVGVSPATLFNKGRTREISRAREGVAYLWTIALGHPSRPLADRLGLAPSSLHAAAKRGRAASQDWNALLGGRSSFVSFSPEISHP